MLNRTAQVLLPEAGKTKQVPDAFCDLAKGKGVYYVTTPGIVTIYRTYDDMKGKCEKDSSEPGPATASVAT